MKREYTKPFVVFESFSMSTNIAAGCELDTPLPSSEQACGYPIRGAVVFVTGAQCDAGYAPEGVYNGYCYHNPTNDKNLFNS